MVADTYYFAYVKFSMYKVLLSALAFLSFPSFVFAQVKQIQAVKTDAIFKIDGEINEEAWQKCPPITDLIEFRPDPGAAESNENRSEFYLLYDDNYIYFGGYCHERSADSVSRELVGRDKIGNSDFAGVIFDTYYDKINGSGFFVTPYGEQFDAKYSAGGNEDDTWNSVWQSEAKMQPDGWTFEVRIPYSALRFSNRENQTWGVNFIRRRQITAQKRVNEPGRRMDRN